MQNTKIVLPRPKKVIGLLDYTTNVKKVNVSITGGNEPGYSFIGVAKVERSNVYVVLL